MGKSTIMETASGIFFDINNPDPGLIILDDIAWHLAHINRFTGAGKYILSVAQHSSWMHDRFMEEGNERLALLALLHDAHETYTGDISSPFKNCPGVSDAIKPIQNRIQRAIYAALNVLPPLPSEERQVKLFDNYSLLAEAYHIVPSQGQGENWNIQPRPTPRMIRLMARRVGSFTAYRDFLAKAKNLLNA